ncbi:hypothetical protein [Streptomyces gardneri]|uniref:hypothetical protein n=1 Tax=Streptomyces gardneri TaxID=66892 RepID=UPI0035DA295C
MQQHGSCVLAGGPNYSHTLRRAIMPFPYPVIEQMSPGQVDTWNRHFAGFAHEQPRAFEEGIWRRTQEPANAEQSGWTSSMGPARRLRPPVPRRRPEPPFTPSSSALIHRIAEADVKAIPSSTPRRSDECTSACSEAPARAFCASHGPIAEWSEDTCDLYLDLFSTPAPRRTEGAAT